MKHDFNRERLLYALNQRIVLSGERPDVLLIVNQHHLLSTLPHLLHRGLRIPSDLSLVFLSNDHAAERLSPLPDRYDLGDRLRRLLAAAVMARVVGEMPASAHGERGDADVVQCVTRDAPGRIIGTFSSQRTLTRRLAY